MPTPPANRYVALGFIGAFVATLLGAAVSPGGPLGAINVFARAVIYVLLVFATTAAAAYWGVVVRPDGRRIHAREVALRTAATAIWLPPLLMFSRQKSWFVAVIWAVLVVEAARLIAFVARMLHDDEALPQTQSYGPSFSVLKQDFPYGISIVGALTIQGAMFSAVGGHAVLASLLYLVGTVAIAYRTSNLFQDLPALNNNTLRRRIPAALLTAMFLIVFAWLPNIAVRRGSGFGGNSEGTAATGRRSTGAYQSTARGTRKANDVEAGIASAIARLRALFIPGGSESPGDSLTIAKRFLDSTFAQPSDGASTPVKRRENTKLGSAVVVVSPVFPGVQLYPEAKPHPRLVAPPLPATSGFGVARPDPLSIPFDGVYWFWRGPSDRPPTNSVVMHGSPSARFFRSTDGGMSMEARQNLGFMVDPKRYGAIEILFENADPFPNTVSILLKIRNTTAPGKPILSLGMEGLSAPASSLASGAATTQRLRFRIPSAIPIGSFDELTVSYYLKGARNDRSARIAVDRFRLVPRGG